MAGIVSTERFSIVLASGTASASANLTKSQVLANCAPHPSGTRVTTVASPVDDYSEYCVDIEFQSGPDRVTVTTAEGTSRALVVEVTVIEFEPGIVQQGTFQMVGASTTEAITAVVLANSYVIAPWQVSGNPATQEHAAVRARFTSTTQLTFDRIGTTGTVDGHWYVIESDGSNFTVQEVSITLTGAASGTDTITSVTMNKTFLIGSYTLSSPADDNSLGSIEAVLTNATTVTIQRSGSTGNVVYTGYAISFAGGGAETVQRGQIAAQGAVASQNVTITSVDLTLAMVVAAGSPISWKNGSLPGGGSSDNADAFGAWDFVDATTIRLQHSTNGGESSNDWSWEVVVWEIQLVTREQDSFRYYDDDGNEATSTALELQNIDLSIARETTFHERVGTQYVGDAPAEAAEFRYKETGDADTEYRTVP